MGVRVTFLKTIFFFDKFSQDNYMHLISHLEKRYIFFYILFTIEVDEGSTVALIYLGIYG